MYQERHLENMVYLQTTHSSLKEYLTIIRQNGEDYSLCTEIVLVGQVKSLFETKNKLINNLGMVFN
jgi:hypothetical protein